MNDMTPVITPEAERYLEALAADATADLPLPHDDFEAGLRVGWKR